MQKSRVGSVKEAQRAGCKPPIVHLTFVAPHELGTLALRFSTARVTGYNEWW